MKIKVLAVLAISAALFLSACGKSEADLTKAVNDALAAANITGVTATVKDGTATLTGEVADITVKAKAELAARSVEGVKAVDATNVKTKPLPTPSLAPVDPMLKGKVEEALKKAGCIGATVEVVSGKVIIKGTVADAKYVQCIQVVNESGATGFDNQLQKAK
jgi:osmotically-inducible protein OsmY